jgi:hypothetical protein
MYPCNGPTPGLIPPLRLVKPYKLHPQARSDLLAGAEYYERESWALAGRFAAEMDRLVGQVCAIRDCLGSFERAPGGTLTNDSLMG